MRLPLRSPIEGFSPAMSAGARFNTFFEAGGDFSPENQICRMGLRSIVAGTGAGEVRGSYFYNASKWFVRGNKLYEFDGTTVTERGTLNTSVGRVYFADNGPDIFDQMMLVDGASGYIWNSSTDTFAEIADADFPANPEQVAHLNFRFIVFDRGTQKFYISDTADGTAWQALNFASKEAKGDDITGIAATRQELILIGERTTEFWTWSGAVDFPFERFSNGVISSGCTAGNSIVTVDGGLMYLENTREGGNRFVRPQGGSAQVVSPNWLNVRLDRMTTSDCFGFSFKYRGHEFVVFQFPTEDQTWVFDASTGEWGRWSYFRNGVHERFLGDCHTFLNNKHYTVSRIDGAVLQIDGDYFSDAGDEIRWEMQFGHIQADGKLLRHNVIQAQIQSGVGELSGFTDPKIVLEWSDNQGRTWSNGLARAMGARGKTQTRARWNQLGKSRDRIYRIWSTDSVKRVLTALEADIAAA